MTSNDPDPSPLIELLDGFRRSKILLTAVAVGIFDCLQEGAANPRDMARRLGLVEDGLERLLEACSGFGLLRKTGHLYENSELAKIYLVSSSEASLVSHIQYHEEKLYESWGSLEKALQGGKSPIQPRSRKSSKAEQAFQKRMASSILTTSRFLADAFDLSTFRVVVDVGGGIGRFALSICERYPSIQAKIFDPALRYRGVKVLARSVFEKAAIRHARVQFLTGDYLKELPEGDLCVLSRVLHHHTDEETMTILKNVYAVLPAGGGVLIAEWILNRERDGPPLALLHSLQMFLSPTRYRIRSIEEYESLLRQAGFRDPQRVIGRSGSLDGILAIKESSSSMEPSDEEPGDSAYDFDDPS